MSMTHIIMKTSVIALVAAFAFAPAFALCSPSTPDCCCEKAPDCGSSSTFEADTDASLCCKLPESPVPPSTLRDFPPNGVSESTQVEVLSILIERTVPPRGLFPFGGGASPLTDRALHAVHNVFLI